MRQLEREYRQEKTMRRVELTKFTVSSAFDDENERLRAKALTRSRSFKILDIPMTQCP